MKLLLLWLVGGCAPATGDTDETGPGDTEAPAGEHVPVVVTLTRDAAGLTRQDHGAEADLCPPGATWLGGNDLDTACATGAAAVVELVRDREGRTFPEDVEDEGALCPSGWEHVGGSGSRTICTSEAPFTVYRRVGDGCGEATLLGYGELGSVWCAEAGQRPVVEVTREPGGATVGEVPPAALCAEEWELLGRSFDGVSVCAGPTGSVVGLTRDVEGRSRDDVADEADLCPAGWSWVGSDSWTTWCWSSAPYQRAALTRTASGETCPAGWTHVGGEAFATVCVRSVG